MKNNTLWEKYKGYALLLCIILCGCGVIYFIFRAFIIKTAQSDDFIIVSIQESNESETGLAAGENAMKEYTAAGEIAENEDEEQTIIRSVLTTDEGKYLLDEDSNILCGPYRDFLEEDINAYSLTIYRYVDDNGLMGYISMDGREITLAIYEEASQMKYGSALVREQGEEEIYYINEEGERFTYGFYSDGYPFAESQGSYARVQTADGSWAVIDRSENVLVEGMDYINELPLVYTYFTGVKDGQAFICDLPADTEDGLVIVYLPEFCDISKVYYGLFAIVRNEKGFYGVVNAVGEEILPAKYYSLSFEVMPSSEGYSSFTAFEFTLQTSADGEYEMVVISDW
ncbi:MAG: WG repeat-containing protein [Lachnospiraceae bacterium]|nr:WG repeat-containing protein [Lachnospiraceae bacterium]